MNQPVAVVPVPHEVELKYAVPDLAAFQAWLATDWREPLAGVEVGEPSTIEVEDLYFDTPHRSLERHGFGARLRRHEGRVTLTIKSQGRPEGAKGRRSALRRRIELEGPATMRLDPEGWPATPARELVDELRGAARLRGLFTISQRRHGRQVRGPEGTALMTLDEVQVSVGRSVAGSFASLEVESVDGREGLLARLGEALEASGLVTPDTRSKEEIAQGLVRDLAGHASAHPLPRVPRSPGVRADDTLAEGGRKVLRMHLARMLSCEAGTRAGEDIEELHKMRVATRRMRAVWRVFDGAYRPRVQQRYIRELRTVATALGVVRDLDVMLEGLGAYAEGLPEGVAGALGPLREAWTRRREAARADLIELLDSRQYGDFVEDYLDFTDTPGAGEQRVLPGAPVLVRDTAAGRIWSAYEHVRAHAVTLPFADLAAYHALRIDAKRLRYTLEAFREVLPSRVDDLIADVVRLQDHLGLLNDADVAATAVRTWLTDNASRLGPDTLAAVGRYLDERQAEVVRSRRRFGPAWRRIEGPAFRRTLALTLAAL